MKPAVFIPTDREKKEAGEKAENVLNWLTDSGYSPLMQAYILQIILECFEEHYNIDIRGGMSYSDDDSHKPKPK